MEEKTFSIPIYDPDKNHIEIDELLSNNSNDLTITFKKPTCPDCGKECRFYSRIPKKYNLYCEDCAHKHIQEDLAKENSNDLLIELYEELNYKNIYTFLTDDQIKRARCLYDAKCEKEEHIKYFTEVKNLYDQAITLSKECKTSVDFEFYALLLQRIDKTINENSYKSDPRNIVFR